MTGRPSPFGGGKIDATRFAMVPRNDVPRSAFDVRHMHKTTMSAGFLVPIYFDEVLPGDSLRLNMTIFARLATVVVPVMDNIYLESFFFFVPNRLLWNNWQRFMGELNSPTDTTEFQTPYVDVTNALMASQSIWDYFGLTLNNSAGTLRVNALPFRAYNLVFNSWFTDEDLYGYAAQNVGDGPDNVGDYGVVPRMKRHDYFTSARPWPQKPINMSDSGTLGGPLMPGGRMTLPQAGAPVSGVGWLSTVSAGGNDVKESGSRTVNYPDSAAIGGNVLYVRRTSADFPDIRVLINDMRTANAVQLMLERNARGGTRYTEIIRSHFGVVSPDARLNRPEFLGGGRANVIVNPVAQTAPTAGGNALGQLAGVASVVGDRHGFSHSFTEHGIILGLVEVRADLGYQQGVERSWFRRTQYDYYWPGLAHLGEQAILNKEIYSAPDGLNDNVFGYQERWAEYKYRASRVSGQMRSTFASPLDVWHLAQKFTSRPVLNSTFITDQPPLDRALVVGGSYNVQILVDALFDARWVRPMPLFSIPGFGPRF